MKDIYTALITPFLDDLSIDYNGIDLLLNKLINEGADHFLLCGTTSEASLLKKKERKAIVDYICQRYPHLHLMVGTCSNNTVEVISQINDFSLNQSIEAFLVVVPYYLKPNQNGIFKHFDMIASSTNKDIIIYNIPSRCGVSIDATTVVKLAKKHHNIVGIKQCGDVNMIEEIKKHLTDFKVYIGDDHLLLEGLEKGADGIISVCSHIDFPLIYNICMNQNKQDDEQLKKLSSHLFLEPNPSCVKYVLNKLGYIQYKLRSPFVKVLKQTADVLDTIVDNYKKDLKDI